MELNGQNGDNRVEAGLLNVTKYEVTFRLELRGAFYLLVNILETAPFLEGSVGSCKEIENVPEIIK